MAATESELLAVDAFLAELKSLSGPIPRWRNSGFGNETIATWGVLDSLGIDRAELRLVIQPGRRDFPSLSLILNKNFFAGARGRAVARLDFAESDVCKRNPPGADLLDLPFEVCGNHIHSWEANREHIRRNGFGALPARSPLPSGVRRLPQALACFAQAVNISLRHEQRAVELPTASTLFEEG